ncbi:type I-E CRISPR-associated protein Cse1/CasA [Streptomyces sp. SCUT-3]|uniref:type I-E CRISPR-associated protein Cse1/CasA n=1 Tax=Streptomyces sp. SCUT-3 TaxID=2684469 RepID=UPI000CB32EB0|nr:type I-E CRISPR-associated protein Cse1/CasA [Streptomyces sp. SCUT-3]PLW66310.1 type I-E CRISPR-associated protein Cse1/CasA [Streptomyces sp. DJ]QMV20807.1 type I-E CRISPR-associated protein Cse1/CasA [Streptomyces sp. SCUT-3]
METDGDLVRGAWLGAVDADGTSCTTGLLDVLVDAHTTQRLELPASTMLPALLRQLLLPVVLDAIGVPRTRREWAERFGHGRFSDAEVELLTDYLGPRRYGDRFRILGGEQPFAQVADLEALNGETKSVAQLVPSIASGNNVPLFSALTEADELLLTPGQALLWLLHAHCWDTASIKTGAVGDPQAKNGKTTGNPTGPLGQLGVVVPVGRNLFETLMLNTPILPDGLDPADRPQWAWDERPASLGWKSPAGPEWSTRPTGGLLDLFTFQSRRIRLIARETEEGPRVHRVIVSAGDRLARTPERDPHTAWSHTAKPKAGQPQRRPRRHVSGRAAWQGLGTLLALALPVEGDGPYTSALLRQAGDLRADDALPADYPLGVEICGLEYGNQSAVVENAIGDSLPLPVASLLAENDWLRAVILECASQADRAGRALDNLDNDLRRASGGDPLPRDKGQRPSSRFLHVLDGTMRRLLAGLRTVGEDDDLLERAELAWELSVRAAAVREAETLLAAVPPRAVVGRVVKVNGKDVVHRSGKAVGAFYKKLAEILPLATEESPDNGKATT